MSERKNKNIKDPRFAYDKLTKLIKKNYGDLAKKVDTQIRVKKSIERNNSLDITLNNIVNELHIILNILEKIPQIQENLRYHELYSDILAFCQGICSELCNTFHLTTCLTHLEMFIYEALSFEKIDLTRGREYKGHRNSYYCIPKKGHGKGRWRTISDMCYFIANRVRELAITKPTIFYKNKRRMKKVTSIKLRDGQIRAIEKYQKEHKIYYFDDAYIQMFLEEIDNALAKEGKVFWKISDKMYNDNFKVDPSEYLEDNKKTRR